MRSRCGNDGHDRAGTQLFEESRPICDLFIRESDSPLRMRRRNIQISGEVEEHVGRMRAFRGRKALIGEKPHAFEGPVLSEPNPSRCERENRRPGALEIDVEVESDVDLLAGSKISPQRQEAAYAIATAIRDDSVNR